jgi:polysaccharide export outer membrane protein
MQSPPPAGAVTDQYAVACPDVLQFRVQGRPDLSGQRDVQANGCVDLGFLGGVRVEGLTPPTIEIEVARLAGIDPTNVRVDVLEYRGKQVYLFGEVTGLQRAVHYEGPERVVDLLRRTGGLTPDAAPDEVRVVRNPQLAQDQPLVLNVDLRAILLKGDQSTNVTLLPYDQVYVPETKKARVSKCLHPWLRPFCKLMPWDW